MKQQPVDYVIFDLLHLDGRRVRDLPYLAAAEAARGARPRRAALAYAALPPRRGGPTCSRRPAARVSRASSPSAADSPYRPGKRTGEWIKTRVWRRQEFVIGGYIPGEGSRAKRVGSLLVGYYDRRRSELRKGQEQKLHFAGGVGSGLKESDLDFLTRELTSASARTAPSTSARRPARRLASRSGASQSSSARSPGPSGPTRARSASPPSRACATTRIRARSSRSSDTGSRLGDGERDGGCEPREDPPLVRGVEQRGPAGIPTSLGARHRAARGCRVPGNGHLPRCRGAGDHVRDLLEDGGHFQMVPRSLEGRGDYVFSV